MGQDTKVKSRQVNSEELLDQASRDELLACIRLLAISVVQHRAKCELVPIENAMSQLRSSSLESEEGLEH